ALEDENTRRGEDEKTSGRWGTRPLPLPLPPTPSLAPFGPLGVAAGSPYPAPRPRRPSAFHAGSPVGILRRCVARAPHRARGQRSCVVPVPKSETRPPRLLVFSSSRPLMTDLDYRPSYLAATIAGALVLVLYVITLGPSTAMWDTSEYIAAA